MLERGFSPAEGGVYISYYLFGSPAHKYKLVPKHWLLELNGQTVDTTVPLAMSGVFLVLWLVALFVHKEPETGKGLILN